MQWYYAAGGQRQGPVSEDDFQKLARDGVIKPDTLVWKSGMADWRPYAAVVAAPPSPGGAPGDPDTEVCAVSGKRYPRREMVQYEGKWISAEHRDEFFQRLREGVAQPGQYNYAGFGIRFAAKFVDGILLGVTSVAVNMSISKALFGFPNYFGTALMRVTPHQRLVFQAITFPTGIAIAIAYACFFISRWDATPGKMAAGLKLIRSDGSKLSIGRIVGRYFAEWLSGMILFIGYFMVLFDDQRRALHDRICDTRVIKAK
jgi:uncharacterized RDD family membrane protein YckC